MDIRIGSFNLLNLRLANRPYYSFQGYSDSQYKRKVRWTAQMFDQLRCQLLGVQEVFDEDALRDCAKRSAVMKKAEVIAPHASGDNDLPRVGLLTTLHQLSEAESVSELPAEVQVTVPGAPEIGIAEYRLQTFSRPVLNVMVDLGGKNHELPARVYVTHLKSRRPKRLQMERDGQTIAEDMDNPAIESRAHLRALIIRAAESAALRQLVLRDLYRSRLPVIVLGDFNDHAKAMTTSLVTGRLMQQHRARRDFMLWHAAALQRPNALKRDLGYTKIYLDEPDSIDHILLSEEFLRDSEHSIGEVLKVDYFNDHLNEKPQLQSDHGAIRATILIN